MPTDPRLAAAAQGSPESVMAQRIADLEKRVAVLERTATIQTGSGAPTQATRDGTSYGDIAGSLLYLRLAGTWKSVLLS